MRGRQKEKQARVALSHSLQQLLQVLDNAQPLDDASTPQRSAKEVGIALATQDFSTP